MNNFEFAFGMLILFVVGVLLLLPIFILRTKGNIRNGEKASFQIMGTVSLRGGGSMIPTHRFNIFSDGLLISSLFGDRFISKKEMASILKMHSVMRSFIEIKLESGDMLRLITSNNSLLYEHLIS